MENKSLYQRRRVFRNYGTCKQHVRSKENRSQDTKMFLFISLHRKRNQINNYNAKYR